jgi:hypothetical protein
MRQAGAALLIMMAILAIGVTSVLISAVNTAALNDSMAARHRNAAVLAEAKSALIGYVAKEVLDLSENLPGRLPCPESPSDSGTANEGRAGSACSPTFPTNKTIGRLPWRTLGISKLVDAASEPLWYAVSPNWVLSTPNPPPVINAGSAGQLTLDGVVDVVAIIIAPGRPLTLDPDAAQIAQGCQPRAQARNDRSHNPAGGNPDYRDYLECQNASSPIDVAFGTAIVGNETKVVINDQVVVITAAELLNALQGPLAERMQRTVAPLLREYSSLWTGASFLPYALAFTPPEANLAANDHCGAATTLPQRTEGLLPVAASAGNCASTWTNFSISGSVTSLGCVTVIDVSCSFRYYHLNALGQLVFGAGAGSTDVNIQASAPHASASFRKPIASTDVSVPAGVSVLSTTVTPQTDGDAGLSLQVRITGTNLCDNTLLGIVCSVLGSLFTTNATMQVDFPQLGTPASLMGTKLSATVVASRAPPYNLLTPAAGEPHYWFMQNQWYRYTYYAISGNASAQAAGGNLTVNGFPGGNGNANDKRFVLALMGPAVAGQTRNAMAPLSNYMEGANAATTASPRVYAYQVYANAGNDRVATCPFNDGAMPCD